MTLVAQALQYHLALTSFLRHLTAGEMVLEFEPGRGHYTRSFLEHGLTVTAFAKSLALDPDLDQHPKLQAVSGDFLEMLLPYRSFAGIWMQASAASLSANEMIARLSRAFDLLVPGGLLYLCLPEGEGVKKVRQVTPFGSMETLIHYYQPEVLDDYLRRLSYTIKDAWRSQEGDQNTLHVIVSRAGQNFSSHV